MSQEQAKEQISYLRSRIKRQREIIGGLEAEGYGGEIVRRSRFLWRTLLCLERPAANLLTTRQSCGQNLRVVYMISFLRLRQGRCLENRLG